MRLGALTASGPAGVGSAAGLQSVARPRATARERGARLAAFTGLSGLAAWRYALIEARPPLLRVFLLTLLSALLGGAMVASAAGEGGRGRATGSSATRLGVIAAVLLAALLVAGAPAQLLLPTGWARFAHGVATGIHSLASATWPYSGAGRWARLDILLVLSLLPLCAGLAFWPEVRRGRGAAVRRGARQALAFGLLAALYVTGVIDSGDDVMRLEGLLLLGLLATWLWLPVLHGRQLLAATAWLVLLGAAGALLTVPLASRQPWFDYRAWNPLGAPRPAVFAWDQTYGPIPWSRSPRTMFTVRTGAPGLWKVTTLDRFDGLRFINSGTAPALGNDLPLPLNDQWYQFARFTIAGLGSQLLPTEDGATEGVDSEFPVRYQADGTLAVAGRPVGSGSSYAVMSYVPRPTPAEMRQAPAVFPAAYERYTEFDLPSPGISGLGLAATDPVRRGVYVTSRTIGSPAPGLQPGAVPAVVRRILASPYGPMYRLVRRITLGARTRYDAVMGIQTYLGANYAYNERPPARRYPLEAFLFEDRIGYCQQFSGAMALMLRMIGIPARVAAGFHTGAYDGSTGTYRVAALDAHSWVEVYFAGIGWVPFDPTPPLSPGGGRYSPSYTQHSENPRQAIAAALGGVPPAAVHHRAGSHRRFRTGAGVSGDVWPALGALVLLGALAGGARWMLGRRRLSRSLGGDGELAAGELAGALRRLGYELPSTVTLAQIETLVRVHGGVDAARYVRRLRDRRYAPGALAPAGLSDRRRLRHGLTAHLGLGDRLRGQWALPPGTLAARLRRR